MNDYFKTCKVFEKFSDAERELLSNSFVKQELKKGEILFKENDIGDSVYFIEAGMIKISKMTGGNENTILAIYKKDDIFGEMALFNIIPRYANAEALANSTVHFLKKAVFQSIRESSQKTALMVMDIILESLALRLRKITDRMYGIY
ncbi:MAG: cyclic nucleotide-binding domain-containing protein [bacterium]